MYVYERFHKREDEKRTEKIKMNTRTAESPRSLVIAYIAMFASLNVLADFVPFTPLLGLPDRSLSFGWIMAPLTGILLGSRAGAASCLLGSIIGTLLGQPLIFGLFTPFRAALSASASGMVAFRRWQIPVLMLISLIIIWLFLPTGREAYPILVFHFSALASILVLRGRLGVSCSSKKSLFGYSLAAYSGNITRHLLGNILSVLFYSLPAFTFILAIPYTFVEQLVFALGTAFIGASLRRLGIHKIMHLKNLDLKTK